MTHSDNSVHLPTTVNVFKQRCTHSDNGERLLTTVNVFKQRLIPSDNDERIQTTVNPFRQRGIRSYSGERLRDAAVERNALSFRRLHISGCENLRTLKCVTHYVTVSYAPRACLFTLFMS